MIKDALAALFDPGDIVELRVPNAGRFSTISGYFDDMKKLEKEAKILDGIYTGVYVTLNPVVPALLARSSNRVIDYAKLTTSDRDVRRRKWLPFDFDPVRPAGISSTDAEHDAAIVRCKAAARYLVDRGWPHPLIGDSGNGAHLLLRIDLPNDEDCHQIVGQCIEAMSVLFSDEVVQVDTGVDNAARIWKLYGTKCCKGDDTKDRPHRTAKLIYVPATIAVCEKSLLRALAEAAPQQEAAERLYGGRFNLEAWFTQNNIAVKRSGPWVSGGMKYVLAACPWNAHTDGAPYVVRLQSGAIAAGCHHNSCAAFGWRDLRALYKRSESQGTKSSLDSPSFMSARDLLDAPVEVHEDLIEGMLPIGGTALLSAKPKVGKTVTAYNLALAVARGEPFLGRRTKQGPVLIVALEEKQAELQATLRRMGVTRDDPIYFWVGRAPSQAIEWLSEEVSRRSPVLIIIDTLQRLIRVRDINDYALVTAATEPLIEIARSSGASMVWTHHDRKAKGGDPGDSPLGTQGLFGSVDTLISMKRTERYRTVSTIQRYGADLEETLIEMDPQTNLIAGAGTREVADVQRAELAIVAYLQTQTKPVDEKTIQERVEFRKKLLVTALRALLDARAVFRTGGGKRGNPYLYTLSRSGVPHMDEEPDEEEATDQPEYWVEEDGEDILVPDDMSWHEEPWDPEELYCD